MQRMHPLAWMALLAGGLMLSGCGSSKSDGLAVEATATADAQPAKDTREPKQVVSDFLDLKRKGNHGEADKLLSEKACGVTRKLQLSIVEIPPDGSIRYEVNAAEMLAGGAHVETTWTYGEGASAQKGTMLFVMRDDVPGWRIVGVIVKSSEPMAQPIALDFEDEQQIRGFQALQAAPQAAPSGAEQQPPATQTAAKQVPKAKETTNQ